MLDPTQMGATAELVRERGMDHAEVEEIIDLFAALRRWHQTSEAHSEASRRFMRLGENDMRAVRYIMTLGRDSTIVTSTMIASHLGISGPSVTKLLDRLVAAGHIRRGAHPTDRRALSIVVTDQTRRSASETVGRDHSRRFAIAASLSPEERRAATKFLSAMAELPVMDYDEPAT